MAATPPYRPKARDFFKRALVGEVPPLCTCAEVLQELLRAYLPVARIETLDAALQLAQSATKDIWDVESADIGETRAVVEQYPALGARDLLHLACCKRRGINSIRTFDRTLASAFPLS